MFNNFPITFNYEGKEYHGEIKPMLTGIEKRQPTQFQVFLNNVYYGRMQRRGTKWETDSPKCSFLVDKISNHIHGWYDEHF